MARTSPAVALMRVRRCLTEIAEIRRRTGDAARVGADYAQFGIADDVRRHTPSVDLRRGWKLGGNELSYAPISISCSCTTGAGRSRPTRRSRWTIGVLILRAATDSSADGALRGWTAL